jgi:N-acetylmuramoyl-L-alanine amidase
MRIAIEVSGEFEYRSDRLHDPDRVYYDILNARPHFENKRIYAEDVTDPLVKRIRVAETAPGVTRVVLELGSSVEVSASVLSSPDRLILELRHAPVSASDQPAAPSAAPPVMPEATATIPSAGKSDIAPAAAISNAISAPSATVALPSAPASIPVPTVSSAAPSIPPAAIPKAAHRNIAGEASLIRTLGLKLQRVVIDPGHGGHDEGTQGPKGLLEKDLVLDVSLRLGKLIEDKMGADVIYTRSDDTFIPLEGRTAIANDKKADLFLSIHANSSPVMRITGVETYYLNFTGAKDALEVASRENAGSGESIYDLHDLIQKISAHDKASESRDFAQRIQSALFAFSARTFRDEKNRGVKTAPFVVLIGANMPSVLAEIGFVSNPREEALLKKPDYRQKLAEALYRGVSKYAESLSHFQMAAN